MNIHDKLLMAVLLFTFCFMLLRSTIKDSALSFVISIQCLIYFLYLLIERF